MAGVFYSPRRVEGEDVGGSGISAREMRSIEETFSRIAVDIGAAACDNGDVNHRSRVR
jgi:hypothetical protein